MRIVESLVLIALALNLVSYLVPKGKRSKWHKILPFLTTGVTIVHIIANGFLLQMLPAYIMVIGLLIPDILKLLRKKDQPAKTAKKTGAGRRILKILEVAAVTLAFIVSIIMPIIFPAAPLPTGRYDVATKSFEWVDKSRPETFTKDPGDNRDLMVKVWYPKQIKTADSTVYYPVLVFSHGIGNSVDSYEVELRELASHGYVVFGINHPYEASSVKYPDGRVVSMSKEVSDSLNSDKQKEADSLLEQYKAAADDKAKESLLKQWDELTDSIYGESVKTWTDDTLFVFHQIEQLNLSSTGIFAGHLNLYKSGVFGHSFGGAIAGLACLEDSRFKAGLNMDGLQYGQLDYTSETSIQQPFMEMASEESIPEINDYTYDRINNLTYRLQISGSTKNNFTDTPLYAPLFRKTGFISGGSIRPSRMYTIIDKYTLAFFDYYLKGLDSALLRGPNLDFTDVKIRIHGPLTD